MEPKPKPKQKRGKRTDRRKEIMRIAAKLFADKGYDGASLSEVAAQMDVSKAALYHHIRNKEEILQEICDDVLVAAIKDTKRINKTNLSPRDKLKWFIRGVIKGVTEDKIVMAVLFENTNSLSPEAREKVHKQKKAFDQLLEDILREGAEKGYFDIHDFKIAVFTIQGACNFGYQWYHEGGRLTPEEIAEEIILLLEKGYLRRNSKSRTINLRNSD